MLFTGLVSPLIRWYYDLCRAPHERVIWGIVETYLVILVISDSRIIILQRGPHSVIRTLLWRSICLENWHQNEREDQRDPSKLVGVHALVSVLGQGVLSDSSGYFVVTSEILIRPNMEMARVANNPRNFLSEPLFLRRSFSLLLTTRLYRRGTIAREHFLRWAYW